MVDLTRDQDGRTRARLLDLVPGRSGAVYGAWLTDRGQDFRDAVQIATLDPFHGYKNAIDDHLADATAVVDAFHVVKLATACVDFRPSPSPAGHHRPPRAQGRPLVRDQDPAARRGREHL